MRIHRNCDLAKDYMAQTDILIDRFVKNNYCKEKLYNTRSVEGSMDRGSLLNTSGENNTPLDFFPLLQASIPSFKNWKKWSGNIGHDSTLLASSIWLCFH